VSVASVSVAAARGAGRWIDALLERPREVLGALVAAQLTGTLGLVLSAPHNGWVYYQGGDQIINTTTGWVLGRLELPPTEVGYLWPLVQVPITWFTGPTFVQALPALVLLQAFVLAPIALLCVYGIASEIGGRLLGYWAAALWVVAPFAAIPLFVDRYHEKWVDQFLPQATGLTAAADYASMVLVLAAAFFVVRSLAPDRVWDAALGGVLFAAAMGTKPSNVLFAAGATLAYPVARRWREATAFALASAPGLLALALWKYRGLGELPAFAQEEVRLAAGSGLAFVDVGRYLDLDFDHWREQMGALREFFWSARLAQWAPLAGLLAVLRVRRGAIAALLAGWLGAYLLVKGFSERASIESGSFWRLLMPAWPAYLLLFAAIPLLVPTLPRRLGERVRSPATSAVPPRWVVVAVLVAAITPAVATAASSRLEPPTPTVVQEFPSGNILTPVDEGIEVTTERVGASQKVTWTPGSWRANVFYRVYRTDKPGDDVQCALSAGAAWSCYLRTTPIQTTRETEFLDESPPAGATYRIGVGTNWLDDPELGDVFVFSPAVRAQDR
jgi:hypothetical protein